MKEAKYWQTVQCTTIKWMFHFSILSKKIYFLGVVWSQWLLDTKSRTIDKMWLWICRNWRKQTKLEWSMENTQLWHWIFTTSTIKQSRKYISPRRIKHVKKMEKRSTTVTPSLLYVPRWQCQRLNIMLGYCVRQIGIWLVRRGRVWSFQSHRVRHGQEIDLIKHFIEFNVSKDVDIIQGHNINRLITTTL